MIVGPPDCQHCTRAIYPKGDGWIHANGNPSCYTRSGERRAAIPRDGISAPLPTQQTPSDPPAPSRHPTR